MKKYDFHILDFDHTICNLEVDWKGLKKELFEKYKYSHNLKEDKLKNTLPILLQDSTVCLDVLKIVESFEQKNGIVKFSNYNKNLIDSLEYFYIISNNLTSTVLKSLQTLNIEKKCLYVVGLDKSLMPKPSKIAMEILLSKKNEIILEKSIYIGDRYSDEIFAKNCTIDFININQLNNDR